MQLALRSELAFVTAWLTFRGVSIDIPDVLIDTGAASTVLNADLVAAANVLLRPHAAFCGARGARPVELNFFTR